MHKRAIIEFFQVSKAFGNKKVLDNISFSIYEGEIFGLLGRSGSGKSTLLKVLLGAYKPDSGKIFFMGKDITGNSLALRKAVGLTSQENSFYEKLTVEENMNYYASLYRVDKGRKELKKHISEIINSVDLSGASNLLSEKLSGGMKRRLDFAISLLHEPGILILDEPTTGLDPLLVRQFWQIVRKISAEGKTIIVISHIFPEIKDNCKRVCILSKGKARIIGIDEKTDLMREFEAGS